MKNKNCPNENLVRRWVEGLERDEVFTFTDLVDMKDKCRRAFIDIIPGGANLSEYLKINHKKLLVAAHLNSDGSFGYWADDQINIKVDIIGQQLNLKEDEKQDKFVYIKSPLMWISGSFDEVDSEFCDWSIDYTIVIVSLDELIEYAVSEVLFNNYMLESIKREFSKSAA
jgi:hypothetical protein